MLLRRDRPRSVHFWCPDGWRSQRGQLFAVKRHGSRPTHLAASRGTSDFGTCLLPDAVHTVEGLSSAHLLDCDGEAAGRW
jgi:hypothetical protein